MASEAVTTALAIAAGIAAGALLIERGPGFGGLHNPVTEQVAPSSSNLGLPLPATPLATTATTATNPQSITFASLESPLAYVYSGTRKAARAPSRPPPLKHRQRRRSGVTLKDLHVPSPPPNTPVIVDTAGLSMEEIEECVMARCIPPLLPIPLPPHISRLALRLVRSSTW